MPAESAAQCDTGSMCMFCFNRDCGFHLTLKDLGKFLTYVTENAKLRMWAYCISCRDNVAIRRIKLDDGKDDAECAACGSDHLLIMAECPENSETAHAVLLAEVPAR